jgi:acetyltransferase-like isoleucine patch superfamily enzyme
MIIFLKTIIRSFLIPFRSAFLIYKLKKKYKTLKISGKVNVNNCTFGSYNYIEHASLSNSLLGDFSYVGKNSYINNTEIGKFTCIGPDVKIGLGEHPTDTFVSIHPVFYSSAKQVGLSFVNESFFKEFNDTKIGNDVWVGSNVIIRGGVSIGDGAIIASGAVVTKNVLPYEIVGGVPAKRIKKRFTKEIIELLLKNKWWNNDINWLRENTKEFHNINEFIDDKKTI